MPKSKNSELAPIRYSFHPTSGPDSEQVAVGDAVWGKLVPHTKKIAVGGHLAKRLVWHNMQASQST